jgi:SAM-dependent methyltransferase
MTFKDHFSTQADRYTRYRPGYPRELFLYLAALPASTNRAWDCGTGNGQAAVALAEFFGQVEATDPSARQIEHAMPNTRVNYQVAPAEKCPLSDRCVDLITVAQALHWFDLARFYEEVRRVGRGGSVLAVWTYGLATITPEIDAVVWRLYSEVLGNYWPPERILVEERYATIPFPFAELQPPQFEMDDLWNLQDLLGYLSTWSSAQKYLEAHGSDPLDHIRDDLARVWGAADLERTVHWPLHLRVGRIA